MSDETMGYPLEGWQQGDCDHLAALHAAADRRSLAEMIADDYYDEIVVETAERGGDVERGGDAYTTISWDHGTTGAVKGPEVKVGDRVWFYGGARLGDRHHGWALNGKVIEWDTPWERFAERIAMLAGHDRGRRKRAEEARAQVDEWLAELRGPYRERIERFHREKPTFDMDDGTYETYPVLMAQRLERWARCEVHADTATLTDDEARRIIGEFRDLPYDEQGKVVHGADGDKYGISGHQFDSACGLARAVLAGAVI